MFFTGPSVAINDVQVIQDSQQETTQVSSNNEVCMQLFAYLSKQLLLKVWKLSQIFT